MQPRWKGAWNLWKRADGSRRLVWSLFGVMTVGFWIGVLAVCIYFIHMFNSVELFGPLLLRKALSMLLLSFSGLLFFSNIITALSSYFLAEDMQLVQSLPISERRVFYLRAVDTMINSSWMISIFGLPVLLAYGIVHGGGPLYYFIATFGLLAYLVPPAALGIVVACLLVRGFSASRIREVMAAVSAAFLIIVLLLLRSLEPERLVDPDAFETLAEFIAVVRTPDASWLPSTWLAELSMWALGQPLEAPFLTAGLLFVAGPSLLVSARWLVAPMWFEAWTQAQEAPSKAATRSKLVTTAIDRITRPLPLEFRALMRKDIRLFLREPGQWTQGMLLVGLVAIYLYSVWSLPLDQLHLPQAIENAIAFLNVGVAGAVLAAIAVRFNFTAVSQEGRAFWVLHSSPVGARRFLWGKFLVGFVPTLVLGEVLVIATNALLHTEPLYAWIGTGTILCLSFGLTGLAIGLGALYPNFKADSAARMAAGPGAILFMVMALTWTTVVICAEAVPVGMLLYRQHQGEPVGLWLTLGLIAVFTAVVLLNLAVGIVPMRRGAAKLWGDLGNVGD
jgi:ABC-2 type transport system permease protein